MTDSDKNFINTVVPNYENASPFDQIMQVDKLGVEVVTARQLQPLLGYSKWQRFEETIERAKLACQNSGYEIKDNFTDAGNLVKRNQGGGSRLSNYRLSRYACYLTAMNGDPRKPEISAAQTYFTVKTREAEIGSNFDGEVLIATVTTAMDTPSIISIHMSRSCLAIRTLAVPMAAAEMPQP